MSGGLLSLGGDRVLILAADGEELEPCGGGGGGGASSSSVDAEGCNCRLIIDEMIGVDPVPCSDVSRQWLEGI